MTTRAVLTFMNSDGKKEIRFFKTVAEAKNAVEFLRTTRPGKFYDFKIKIIKPY